MKNKVLKIIIALIIAVLLATNIYFIFQLRERDNIIDKLENKVENQKKNINNSKDEVKELEYQLSYYEDMYGKYDFDEQQLNQLTYNEFLEMINKKESFIVLISQTYCSHCIEFKPTYAKIINKYKLPGYELDLLTLTKEEYKNLMELINVDGTPTTLLYKDGEEIEDSRLIGQKSEEDLIETFKSYNYMN